VTVIERVLVGAPAEPVLAEHVRRAAEGVGADQVGAGLPVRAVDAAHDVGAREIQVLVAALVLRAAEIVGVEAGRLQHRPHRPVEDEDALQQRLAQAGHDLHGTALRCRGFQTLTESAGPP